MGSFKKIFIFLFLFLYLSSFVFSSEFYFKNELDIDLKIYNEIEIIPKKTNYKVSEINVDLNFIPVNYHRQNLKDISFFPSAKIINDSIRYSWKNPTEKKLEFGFDANVLNTNNFIKVDNKVNFPILDLDDEYKKYLVETDYVDYSNYEIRKLANDLAFGLDDLMEVTYEFSRWVNENINYELNSDTVGKTNKASWVLENKIGVCDEFSTLFISLLRSVGIPAKFVTGISYTEDLRFSEKWNFHSWVEIYFPGYGFVSFDPTYGEFGYVNTAHIKLAEFVGPGESSTSYEWISENAEIKTNNLKFDININDFKDEKETLLKINSKLFNDKVDIGSYNLLILDFFNDNDFYVIEDFLISKTNGIEFLDEHNHFIFLKPNSQKTIFLPFKIDDNLDDKYIYTFDILVETKRKSNSNIKFDVSKNFKFFSLDDVEEFTEKNIKESSLPSSKQINLNCTTKKNNYLVDEIVDINCYLTNIGNTFLDNLSLCLMDDCIFKSLGILETKNVTFNHKIKDISDNKFTIEAYNEDIYKTSDIFIDVFKRPILNFEFLNYSSEIKYGDEFSIDFKIKKSNLAKINFFNATISSENIKQEWFFDEFDDNIVYSLVINSKQLYSENNEFDIIVIYEDSLGKKYKLEEKINIKFIDVSFWDKINMSFNKLIDKINEKILYVLIFFMIMFFILIMVVYFIKKE
ncbi:MAG: transglutaminase-like domain-containing protein [Candidatus Woesearchaeota archaeon]